jgi:hypothetical protein
VSKAVEVVALESDDEFQPEKNRRSSSKGDGLVKKRGRPPIHRPRQDDVNRFSTPTPKGKNHRNHLQDDNESDPSSSFASQFLLGRQTPPQTHHPEKIKRQKVIELSDSDQEEDAVALDRQDKEDAFAVHTFSEWPGQTEGEPMDLPHIWNVISMQYPEDHPKEVCEPSPLLQLLISFSD